MQRPNIKDIKKGSEVKRWYWLKQELVDYCKATKLPYSGTKFEILDRIAHSLNNTIENQDRLRTSKIILSKFDWRTEKLSLETTITDNYKNTQNVRSFFIKGEF